MPHELIKETRSIRIYDESVQIDRKQLIDMIEAACLAPSGANRQATRFYIVNERGEAEKIWPHLRYAAALKDWDGPAEGERPSALLLLLSKEKTLSAGTAIDMGLAIANARLAATAMGFGSCIFRAFNQEAIEEQFDFEAYHVNVIVTIGKPAQSVVLENADDAPNLNYWMDEDYTHHVPKLTALQRLL